MEQKIWDAKTIKQNLVASDKWAVRGLIAIYDFQTVDERNSNLTVHKNGVGFNGCDSEILTSFAKFYLDRGFLSPKQMTILKKKIQKYSGQLCEIANSR